MSVLTKVFVVLVTVLSILLVALVVPFIANTEDYRAQAAESERRANTAFADARLKQSMIEGLQSKESQVLANLNNARTNLETQLVGLNEKLAKAEAEALDAKSAKAKSEADFSRLTAAEYQHAEIQKALETELSQRRTDMTALQTQVIQLADRIKEIDSQRQALDRERKRDAEQVVLLQEENAKLQTIISKLPPEARNLSTGGTAPQPFEPEMPIQGQVTKIDKVQGETFVQINVGKNDGVEQNMKFIVHRGDQYLGSLVVTYVDTKAASGRMQLEKGQVAAGDQVLTGGR